MPPKKEPTGSTQLPLSRIKKMIALDQDISLCSSNATFLIALATEMFIQYMAEQGHNVVKSERKPRRNIQYRDLSSAVSRLDNLEFLSDVVPKTVPYKAIKEKNSSAAPKAGTINANGNGGDSLETTQMTLDGRKPLMNGAGMNGFDAVHAHSRPDESADAALGPNEQLEMEIRSSGYVPAPGPGINNPLTGQQDVEMS